MSTTLNICVADLGGSIRNSSSRIYETLQAESRKVKHNGRGIHKILTRRANMRQSIAHMAMGEPWEAVEVKNGVVVGVREVRAGCALIDLLTNVSRYRLWTPLVSSIAGVKGTSPLSVSCVDWERSVRLSEEVVEPRAIIRSSKRTRAWKLPARPWQGTQDNLVRLRYQTRTRVYVYDGDRPLVDLPSAMEVTAARTRLSEVEARGEAAAGDEVLVSRDLDIMTKVEATDPRRQPLVRIRGRREKEQSIASFGHHVRIDWRSSEM